MRKGSRSGRATLLPALLICACSTTGEIGDSKPTVTGHLCGDGMVIDQSKVCDQRQDCRDNSDESDLACGGGSGGCTPGQFRCANGTCTSGLCNGRNDCPTGEDEEHCGTSCDPGFYACADLTCRPARTWCNKTPDCPSQEDEMSCPMSSPPSCDAGQLSCGDKCITSAEVCDGVVDCTNKEDEPASCKTSTPPPSGCGTLPASGKCEGTTTRKWCEAGAPKSETCAAGKTCQIVSGTAQCAAATPPPSGCGDVPASGKCEGTTTRKWCEAGALKSETCAGGKTCQIVSGTAQCQAATPPASGCMGYTIEGKCDADNKGFKYCTGDVVVPQKCTGTDTCQVDPSTHWASCGPATPSGGGTGCGSVPEAGMCAADGSGYKYCDYAQNKPVTEPCPTGTICKDGTFGAYCDLTGDGSSCGDVTVGGECWDWSGGQYCDGTNVVSFSCASEDSCTCAGSFCDCEPDTCADVNYSDGVCKDGNVIARCVGDKLYAHPCALGTWCDTDASGRADCF